MTAPIGREPRVLELDAALRELEASDAFAGVVRITVAGGERFAQAYGPASRAWHIPNTLETRFDTASITKLFTAVVTLQEVDAGSFDLDTSAIDYLGLEGTAISPAVTVRHLLSHTSGIGDDADEEAGERYEDVFVLRPNYSVTETADFLPQFVHRASNFPPGTGVRYNNCAYVLLGLMVERATGHTYREVVRERVFEPAAMRGADFLRMDRVNERLAEGANPIRDEAGALVGWNRNIYSYPPIGSPDGGAHVTAADLDAFIGAVTTGRLLSSTMTAAFLTPQVPYRVHDGWTLHWGFGPSFRVDDDGTVVYLQKGGSNVGVSGVVRHYPARDLTLVMLSNIEDGVEAPIDDIDALIAAGAFD